MGCSEFLEQFSDYFDGTGDAATVAKAEAHLASCDQCRRYRDVVERGRELMRAAPAPRVPKDFHPRLRHRIYHIADADALARTSVGSATSGAAVLGIAVLLTFVAWSPKMRREAEVELAPIVVNTPRPARSLGLRLEPVSLRPRQELTRPIQGFPGTVMHLAGYGPHPTNPWETSQLIWDYSPLNDPSGRPTALGLD